MGLFNVTLTLNISFTESELFFWSFTIDTKLFIYSYVTKLILRLFLIINPNLAGNAFPLQHLL